jgi:hypothetical protein
MRWGIEDIFGLNLCEIRKPDNHISNGSERKNGRSMQERF